MTQLDVIIKPDDSVHLSLYCSEAKSEWNTANLRYYNCMMDEVKAFVEIMVAAIPDLRLNIFRERAAREEICLDELRKL